MGSMMLRWIAAGGLLLGGGRQTVTFPFQIAVADIAAQAVDLLAEGSMRVSFRGHVYPASSSGFAPIPFARIGIGGFATLFQACNRRRERASPPPR